MSRDPVDLATGSKSEFSVDLRVAVAGPDFAITRHDTSNPAHTGPGLVGANQTLSSFTYVTQQFESEGNWQRWYVYHHEIAATRRFDSGEDVPFIPGPLDPPAVAFLPEGPATDSFEPTELVLDGDTYAVWKHVQPGKWTQYFYRKCIEYEGDVGQSELVWCAGITPVPDQYQGLLLYEIDAYGNSRRYVYKQYGPIGPDRQARLDRIIFDGVVGGGLNVHTAVRFFWDAGSSSNSTGRLKMIAVRRRQPGSNDWITIQRVKYVYLHDSSQGQHFITVNGNEHLGTIGDLVLVLYEERLDGANWHQRAIHYRYHNPTENEDPEAPSPDADSDGYIEYGGEHQLRMVIEPEQIEHYAKDSTWTTVAGAAFNLLNLPDSAVVELASKIVTKYYDEPGYRNGRVEEQFVLQGCDCAGTSSGGGKLTYDYWEYESGSIDETTKITEAYTASSPYDTVRTVTFDDITRLGVQAIPYSVNHAVFEGDAIENPNTRRWVTHRAYGTHELEILRATPSALDSYTPGEPGVGGQPATPPSYQSSTTEGLIEQWSYNDEKLRETYTVNGELVEEWVYGSETDPILKHYPVEHRKYPAGSTGPVELTTFDYGSYQSGTFEIAWKATTREAESIAENGPGGTYSLVELYDDKGRVFWTRQWDGSLVHREFDVAIGKVSKETQNAEPVDLTHPYPDAGQNEPNWGRDSNGARLSGGTFVTEFTYDLVGRIRSSTKPGLDGDITTYVSREMLLFAQYDAELPLYTETRLPHIIEPGVFGGPAVRTWYSGTGNVVGSQSATISSGEYDVDINDYGLGTELSRSSNEYTSRGQLTRSTVWHRLPDESETYVTKYKYDDLGRLESTIAANGNVTTYEYDLFDRQKRVFTHVVTGQQGGEDIFSTAELVAEYYYDSDGTTTDGVGNGNRTFVREHAGDTTTRDTKYFYDRRDRLVKTEHPLAPHEFAAYDNLNRVVGRATFSTLPTGIEPDDIDSNNSARLSLAQTSYSQRGLPYRSAVAIDPTDATPDFLETHTWFDESGRAIAVAAPTSPVVKTEYDGLGQAVVSYSTNRVYGSGDDYADLYDAATRTVKVDGDVVYKEVQNSYHDDVGVIDLVTVRRRAHHVADTSTGALSGLTSTASVASFVGYHYDELNRLDATINFGTNTPDVFASGGNAPQWPPQPNDYFDYEPDDFPDAITTLVSYDIRGLVDTETDPLGIVTKYFYDSLGRRYATVENYETPYSIGWSASRWSVTNGLDFHQPDLNRTTSVVFDAAGNVVKQVAHPPNGLSGEQVRITEYEYGVTTGGVGHDSLTNNNNLLFRVKFPKEDTAGVGDTAIYWVTNHYNRLGELIKTEDQNSTVHEFSRDSLGRTIRDEVTDFAFGIDDEIVAITYGYDDWGRQYLVESRDDSDDVVNAVHFHHSPLGEVTDVYQDHDGVAEFDTGTGAPTGNTIRVENAHDTSAISTSPGVPGANYSRLGSLTYPDGETIEYEYDAAGISRTEAIANAGASFNLAEYDYLAESIVAQARYYQAAQSWVMLDRNVEHNGERTDGTYPGWDEFGRVIGHRWVDHTFGPHGTSSSIPNRTSIVELTYTYDKAGNLLSRFDGRPNSYWNHRHEEFEYDDLHRAVESRRGVRVDQSTFTYEASSQQWTLDMLGNWEKVRTNPNTGGTGWTTENRDHNRANEMKSRDPDGPGGGSNPPLDLTFDHVGNITSQDTSPSTTVNYVHDGWNRLVRIEQDEVVRGEYTYNGLHWRITRRADVRGTDANDPINPPDGTIDEIRYLTYSAGWQLLQEDVDVGENASIDRRMQYVWGVRGTDDLILRREDGAPPTGTSGGGSGTDGTYERQRIYLTDTIGSPVAILDNANAAVVERISYDAYGNARHHSPADLDGNGAVDGWDQALLLGAWGDDVADIADIDRNGDVDGWDQALLLGEWGAAMPAGWITYPGEDNIIGFAGYVHNKEAPGTSGGVYLARHRWYDPLLGRWLSRDPAGYVDGMNVYLYVAANPLVLVDPLGLFLGGLSEYFSTRNYCEGFWGFFGGSGTGTWRDNAQVVKDRQTAIANQQTMDGKITSIEAKRTEEYLQQGLDDVANAETNLTQARVDLGLAIVLAPTAMVGGSVAVAGVAVEIGGEMISAGVDFSQGETTDGLARLGGAAAGPLASKGINALGDLASNAFKSADDMAEAAITAARGTNNAATREALETGNQVHDRITDAVRTTKGEPWKANEAIPGTRLRPDVITPKGRPVEIKPGTPSGIRAGHAQIQRYKAATRTNGRVLYYNTQNPFGPLSFTPIF